MYVRLFYTFGTHMYKWYIFSLYFIDTYYLWCIAVDILCKFTQIISCYIQWCLAWVSDFSIFVGELWWVTGVHLGYIKISHFDLGLVLGCCWCLGSAFGFTKRKWWFVHRSQVGVRWFSCWCVCQPVSSDDGIFQVAGQWNIIRFHISGGWQATNICQFWQVFA